jgi:predicted RNA-binding Zn ribbon-like protein
VRHNFRYHQKYIAGNVTCQDILVVILVDNRPAMIYIIFVKNLDQLKTGSKPAPGELVIVQGLVNTLDMEVGTDEIATPESLKAWLVRYGLMKSNERVSTKDHRTVLAFRRALRQLLLANNGEAIQPAPLKQLNQLARQYPLGVFFKPDGSFSLSPAGHGIEGALGYILARMVKAVDERTWSRLKACRETNCQWAFYDNSKNHSGRWCSMAVCGSRDKARAYRKRHHNNE